VPETFVDEWLIGRRSDVLFSARIGGRPGFLYLLVEHQSTVDPLMPYRVLRYMVRIWERWLANNADAKTLPIVVPVVVHHSDTGWSAALSLEDLFDADRSTRDELGPVLPRLTFLLDDLTAESDDALHARAMTAFARLTLWALRDTRKPGEFERKLPHWAEPMRRMSRSQNGVTALAVLMRYALVVSDTPREQLERALREHVGEEVLDAMKTAGEQLIEEGLAKGLERGRVEGQREVLLRLMSVRFGELPIAIRERVAHATPEDLAAWTDRILVAKTLGEFLGDA
jgi:predicted transposase YdaD